MNDIYDVYTNIKNYCNFFMSKEDVKVYQIADISNYLMFVVIINNEFKIDIKISIHEVKDSILLFKKVYNILNNGYDFYLNRYIKLKKIKRLINDKII